MLGQPGHNTPSHARLSPGFLNMDEWMTTQLKVSLIRISQTMCVIDLLGLFFDILSVGVCTTWHLQTPFQMVQELKVCC